MQIAMIQDKLMPLAEVHQAYLDRAMFFGDGVYEVLRSYKGQIFALDEHMDRFANSLAAVEIEGISLEKIRERVQIAFDQAGIPNAKIYFHVTRGAGTRDAQDISPMEPSFFLTISELEDSSLEKQRGISVCTHPDERWKNCHIKSLNLLPNVLAKRAATRQGAQEAILVDQATGLITEGAASSFFGVLSSPSGQSELHTSPLTANILPSVTRHYVLKAAGIIDLPVVEKSLSFEQAAQARELFIAVTTKDIVPIVQFNGNPIGSGTPGDLTNQLISVFASFI